MPVDIIGAILLLGALSGPLTAFLLKERNLLVLAMMLLFSTVMGLATFFLILLTLFGLGIYSSDIWGVVSWIILLFLINLLTVKIYQYIKSKLRRK